MTSERTAAGSGAATPGARRVLWLIKGLGLGGAERLLVSSAARLDRNRFDVEVAYLLPGSADLVPALHELGVRTHCLDARRNIESGWPRRLGRLLRDRQYELVHTHSPIPAVAARVLAGGGPVFVHTEHNLWSSYRRPTAVANAATFPRNAHVFAVSDAVHASIVRPGWQWWGAMPPVETLRHGIDPATVAVGAMARARARELLGIPAGTPVLGTVASFTAQKDHIGLLAAVDRIRAQVPDVLLLLVGAGPLEPAIRAEVRRRHLDDQVRFLGSRTDVADLLPGLDVFVLNSTFEGLPIALLEAMASGVACVATRVGGVPEVIRDAGEGQLVDPGNPPALAAALLALLIDEAGRAELAGEGRRRALADFDIPRAARRTEELYLDLLS